MVQRSIGSDGAGLAQGLGWFSIGLGLAELTAPRALAQFVGVRPNGTVSTVVRALGVREIAHGVAILARPQHPAPVWSRLVGDVLDLAVLGWALRARRTKTERVVAAIAAVAGVMALDAFAGRRLQQGTAASRPVTAVITINRTPVQVYSAWRDLEELPRFMTGLESVRVIDRRHSRWSAKLPTGNGLDWEAEIVDDRPGECIGWRTLADSELDHEGEVTFRAAPGGRGTEVRVEIRSGLAGGAIGAAIAKAFASEQVKADLRRFKQMMETGAIVHSDASLHEGMHPAQPSEQMGVQP